MSPEFLFLSPLSCHSFGCSFALASNRVWPLVQTLMQITHTHTHRGRKEANQTVVSSSLCYISLPVNAQSPTGNGTDSEMHADGEWSHRYTATALRNSINTAKRNVRLRRVKMPGAVAARQRWRSAHLLPFEPNFLLKSKTAGFRTDQNTAPSCLAAHYFPTSQQLPDSHRKHRQLFKGSFLSVTAH